MFKKQKELTRRIEILEHQLNKLNTKIKQIECKHRNLKPVKIKMKYSFDSICSINCKDCGKEIKWISDQDYDDLQSKCSEELEKIIHPKKTKK